MSRVRDVSRLTHLVALRRLQQDHAAAMLAKAAETLRSARAEHRSALSRLEAEQENWEFILTRRSLDIALAAISAGSIGARAAHAQGCEADVHAALEDLTDREQELRIRVARSDAVTELAARAGRGLRRMRELALLAALEDRVAGSHKK